MKKFILSFTCFLVSLFLFVPMDVKAYTSEDNFYPIIVKSSTFDVRDPSGNLLYSELVSPTNDKYHYNNPQLDNVSIIYWWQNFDNMSDSEFTFPYNSSLYDYYIMGSLTGYTGINVNNNSTFKPTTLQVSYRDFNTNVRSFYNLTNLVIYNIDTVANAGFGFYAKIDFQGANNTGIDGIRFFNDKDGSGSKPANLFLEMGILAIEKGSSQDQVNQQILNKLEHINSNINSTNSTINNATNNIIGSMQESVDNVTNGYTGEVVDQANNVFNNAAADLNSIESDLVAITDQKILDYTTTAFDSNIITDLGASFLYVVTWFNNFWDIGGLFTQLLYTALALFVAFFILKGGFS